MLQARITGLRMASCAAQMLVAAALFVWADAAFRWMQFPLLGTRRTTVVELAIILCALFADHLRTKDIRDDRLDVRSFSFVLRRSTAQTGFVGLAFFAYAFVAKDVSLSRVFLGSYLAGLFGALLASGWMLPRALGGFFSTAPTVRARCSWARSHP